MYTLMTIVNNMASCTCNLLRVAFTLSALTKKYKERVLTLWDDDVLINLIVVIVSHYMYLGVSCCTL